MIARRIRPLLCILGVLVGAGTAEGRKVLLDASRGFAPGVGFEDYTLMETFMEDRGFEVLRSTASPTPEALSTVDVLVVGADWMAAGAHPPAGQEAIRAFVNEGGVLIAIADAPGPATEGIDALVSPLGIACGPESAAEGKITVEDHPTVDAISGLTFPPGSLVRVTGGARTIATNRNGQGVIAVLESGNSVVLVLGAPIWRNDLWTEAREQVLRQTLGWLAREDEDLTPVLPATWGTLKR